MSTPSAPSNTSQSTGSSAPPTSSGDAKSSSKNGGADAGKSSGSGLLRSDGRVAFWPGFRLTALTLFVLLGWGAVFFNGVTLSSLPFRQMVNIASVQVPNQEVFNEPREASTPPKPVVASSEAKIADAALASNVASHPTHSIAQTPQSSASDRGEPENGQKGLAQLDNKSLATLVIPIAPEGKEPRSVNVDRMKHYFGIVGIESSFFIIFFSWFIGFMSYPYTNLLLLTWLSATLGSLVNYTVIALRRSDTSDSRRGAGRMLHSLTGSLVVGVGLGFTMYVAIVGGATVITKSGLSITTPDDYANKASIISLLTLLAALFPVWFLNVLETRLQQAERASGQRSESSAASATIEVKPRAGAAGRNLEAVRVEVKGNAEFVAKYSAEIAEQVGKKLDVQQ